MSATSFVDLMSDPSFIEQQKQAREREQRESHDRRVRRGSHEPGNVKPTPQQLRDSITCDRRSAGFDHEIERQRRSSGAGKPKQGERNVGR